MQTTVVAASYYPLILEGIRAMLKSCDDIAVISTVASQKEAVSKIEETAPDVAILDLHLPDGCGLGVVNFCKELGLDTKYLLISSIDKGKYFEQAIMKGAHGFLLNSLNGDELASAIRTVIANEIYVHPKLASAIFGAKVASDGNNEPVLTPRQRQTIELMANGCSNKEIASHLSLSIETVNTHVKQILKKLQAKDRAQAVAIAFRKSLII